MSDITERLREIRDRDCYDAADEIERLRAELAAERESATKANLDFVKMLRRADALEAERDALRALLEDAREAIISDVPISPVIARIDAALNKGGEDE